MADAQGRRAALSDRRRLLFDQLASGSVSETAGPARRGRVAAFYDDVSARLDARETGPFARFLNYGYFDGDDDRAVVELPVNTLDRTSVKLVAELVGDCPVKGRRVLDVGCGRGGAVDTLLRLFAPASVIGLDLSPVAIAFCRRSQRDVRARFLVGDAQRLPFSAGAFDVVTNLESSHCYPDPAAFYSEVRRVLAPGGSFLYTDMLGAGSLPVRRAALASVGLNLTIDRDITANVLASCDLVARRRLRAFSGEPDSGLYDFLAVPGSAPYEELRSGAARYVIWRLDMAR